MLRSGPGRDRPGGGAGGGPQGRNSIALKMAPKMAPKWNFEKGHMSQLKRVKSKKGLKMHPKRARKLKCYQIDTQAPTRSRGGTARRGGRDTNV